MLSTEVQSTGGGAAKRAELGIGVVLSSAKQCAARSDSDLRIARHKPLVGAMELPDKHTLKVAEAYGLVLGFGVVGVLHNRNASVADGFQIDCLEWPKRLCV